MLLRDAIARLDELPDSATLFVERLSGKFRPESRAELVELSEADLERPVSEVAAELAPGTEYFLEVFLAREIVDGWCHNLGNQEPTVEQVLERIIYYAENDA
jgi:hypothetical protein